MGHVRRGGVSQGGTGSVKKVGSGRDVAIPSPFSTIKALPLKLWCGCVFRNTGGFITPEPRLHRNEPKNSSRLRLRLRHRSRLGGLAAMSFSTPPEMHSFSANRGAQTRENYLKTVYVVTITNARDDCRHHWIYKNLNVRPAICAIPSRSQIRI